MAFSAAGVRSFSANELGHITPSRFAETLKPNVA
jgi:hypothetical protein